jgi:hypothetical protein
MAPYLHLHRAARWVSLAAALLLVACAGPSPHVKVLGAEQGAGFVDRSSPRVDSAGGLAHRPGARFLTVFVEVVNPTNRDLALSRLEYDLQAKDVFADKGNVALTRRVGAGSTAIVEIPVPVDGAVAGHLHGVPYRLVGRLYAHADHVERFWSVAVKGELETSPVAGDHILRVKLGPSQ